MTIDELIERLEKATGPDRGLDGDIAVCCGEATGYVERLGKRDDGWVSKGAHHAVVAAPTYTASIDAALTLIPSTQNWSIETDPGGHWAKTWTMEPSQIFGGQTWRVRDNESASAAIAFCIAALKCRNAIALSTPLPSDENRG